MRHHHRFAGLLYMGTMIFALLFGSWYAFAERISEGLGIYWAIQTVTTVGYGDVAPRTDLGHYLACIAMLVGVAFWTSSFALITSWLVSFGLQETRKHITETVGDKNGH